MIPIVVGLLVLGGYFEARSSAFLGVTNLTNLCVQASIFILLGMGEIWLLLLGEIDLSLGYVAGLSAAVATILVDNQFHWAWYLALPLGVATAVGLCALSGALVIGLKLPSFIVTLAGLLGFQGLLIWVADSQGTGGTIPVQEKVLYNIVNGQLSTVATLIIIAVIVAVLAFMLFRKNAGRRSQGLEASSMAIVVTKIVGMVVAGGIAVWIFNSNRGTFTVIRGMPYAMVILFAMLAGGTFILNRTKPGRYIYAIGGNAEAARRSGIRVNRYRLLAFALTGFTAGVAGLVYASQLGGISDGINGGTLVLYAVASAVIGGTSLFGGRGRMVHALIGGFVIATIYNGMALLSMSAYAQYMATAVVLLAAVTIDTTARRGSTVSK